MSKEELLLQTIIKLDSQVFENQEDIRKQMLETISAYGNEKYQEGYRAGCLPEGMWYME